MSGCRIKGDLISCGQALTTAANNALRLCADHCVWAAQELPMLQKVNHLLINISAIHHWRLRVRRDVLAAIQQRC
jgi:hypothetical protein